MSDIRELVNKMVEDSRDQKDTKDLLDIVHKKLREMVAIPVNDYRWLHFNLGFFEGEGKHVVIINDNSNHLLTPEIIKSATNSSGSEEALFVVAQGLADLGYRVTCVCKTIDRTCYTLPSINPRFHNIDQIEAIDSESVDVCLAWRCSRFERYKKFMGAAPIIHISHDWAKYFNPTGADGAAFMSKTQMEDYLQHTPELTDLELRVVGNGVSLEDFDPCTPKDKYKCVFVASYNRGLRGVLEAWKDIHSRYPQATLDIYYGRESWGCASQEEMTQLVNLIDQHKDFGVTEMGRVSHQELHKALDKASMMVNTSKFMETYSIATAKAVAAGVIPVITDTVEKRMVPESIELMDRTTVTPQVFTKRMFEVLDLISRGEDDVLREQCRQHAKDNLTWQSAISRYADLIEKVLSKN